MENPGQSNFNDQPEESRQHIEIPEKGRVMGHLKSFIMFLLLVALILGSFWISFQLGRRILAPVKKQPDKKIEVAIPEPSASIAGLQSWEELEAAEEAGKLTGEKEQKVEIIDKGSMVPVTGPYYKVQAGYFNVKANALRLSSRLEAQGFSTYVKPVGKGWRVQAGAYSQKTHAKTQQAALKKKGFDSIIIYE